MSETIAAVVVTYNRKKLLTECLDALLTQTRPVDKIILIDNASTDGTPELLKERGYLDNHVIGYIRLSENTGGAGGFHEGVKRGHESGYDWLWLMDDDAVANREALQNLLNDSLDENNIYGSTAARNGVLSWPMQGYKQKGKYGIYLQKKLPKQIDVNFIPFIGILLSKEVVKKNGLPSKEYFLAADDVEYCLRARKKGSKIILLRDSQIDHPLSNRYYIWLPFRRFYSLKLDPWKRYYDVRNRLFIAKKYYGIKFYFLTIPGSFFRLIATLIHEGDRFRQIQAFTYGMIDGFLNKGGRRHDKWGL
jgi:GT2 family glycosyltransferase